MCPERVRDSIPQLIASWGPPHARTQAKSECAVEIFAIVEIFHKGLQISQI